MKAFFTESQTRLRGRLPMALLLVLLVSWAPGTASAEEIDFNRDIRPILSENCFHCHGPDAEARKADLRLDVEAGSRADLGGYQALVPGKPDESEAVLRIFSDDPEEIMPPPKSKRRLTEKQKDLLRDWIRQGAAYDEHWAFVAPVRPEIPAVADPAWSTNPVDGFVLKRLTEAGLEPSPEADRRTLIRRVSLDLTGLPPTPEEVEAFVRDSSEGAYESVVDRLLTSSRFGERWARPWLDLARYADSNGYQADQLRDSWAYRDWLIKALNANMPFDQFTIEQLAGDLLPDSTADQKVATGFHRTVTCNVEAGVHPEENRTNQVVDRVNTTGTVWLGATIECAQCHDHKYDPFTMKDYYGLFAFFNNTPLEVENPSGRGVSFDFWGPKMELPMMPEEAKARDEIESTLEALRSKRDALQQSTGGQEKWEESILESLKRPFRWEELKVVSFESSGGEEHRLLEDQSVLVTGNLPGTSTYVLTATAELDNISAFKVEALTHPELLGEGPGRGDAERTNFILSEFEVRVVQPGQGQGRKVALHSAKADFSQANWEVEKAIDGDRKTGWGIGPEFHKAHWATFLPEEPVGIGGGATIEFTFDQNYGRGKTLGRVRVSALVGDPGALDIPQDVAAAIVKPEADRSGMEKKAVQALYMESNPDLRKMDLQILSSAKKLKSVQPPTTLVMVELDEPRETHVLMRGNYLSQGDKVDAATPAALPPIDPGFSKDRLGLARWLVAPENPLVARVTVNRWWAEIFGKGIVKTLEDFGTQSEPPTHPALLDCLATEFVESGWSMKHMLKLMVMSQAYRQDSRITPQLLEKDPENRLYARGPRFRMSAEMIRDNALAVSGLLSSKMFGPPVMPHQPTGIWRQVGRNEPKWIDAMDEDRYRRGVYVIWRRAAPYPSFVNFDGPDRSACVVARPRTNTPLQALTLLNDPAYVEMALGLASRLMSDLPASAPEARIDRAFELVLARKPAPEERNQLVDLFRERLEHARAHPEKAREVLRGNEFAFKPGEDLPVDELAAWFYVTNVLLNLDETVTKG